LLGSRNEAIESLFCLVYALFRKRPHIGRHLEMFGAGHG
jgi:hypothetical protein